MIEAACFLIGVFLLALNVPESVSAMDSSESLKTLQWFLSNMSNKVDSMEQKMEAIAKSISDKIGTVEKNVQTISNLLAHGIISISARIFILEYYFKLY